MTDERALVERCIAGEPRAWEGLARAFAPPIAEKISFVTLRCLGRPARPDEADEIAQEVFVRLARDGARSLRAFGWRCSLKTYILTLAASCAIDRFRREGRAGARIVRWARAREAAPSSTDPAEELLAGETEEAVREALGRLPPRDRLLVEMRFWRGLENAEIARALGTSPDAVRSALRRALEVLEKRLKKATGPDREGV